MGAVPLPLPWVDWHRAGHPEALSGGLKQVDCPFCKAGRAGRAGVTARDRAVTLYAAARDYLLDRGWAKVTEPGLHGGRYRPPGGWGFLPRSLGAALEEQLAEDGVAFWEEAGG